PNLVAIGRPGHARDSLPAFCKISLFTTQVYDQERVESVSAPFRKSYQIAFWGKVYVRRNVRRFVDHLTYWELNAPLVLDSMHDGQVFAVRRPIGRLNSVEYLARRASYERDKSERRVIRL